MSDAVRILFPVVAATLAAASAASAAGVPDRDERFLHERCEYREAGPPGPPGNRLVVVSGGPVWLYRDGPKVAARYGRHTCTETAATVHNVDRIVVLAGSMNDGETSIVDETTGRFAPGASRERAGSEIEVSMYSRWVEYRGSSGADRVVVRTLGDDRVALNLNRRADRRVPDYDVIAMEGAPKLLKIRGHAGDDLIDTRRLTGMGDSGLRRVIRLFGDGGDDTILGGPGGEWRIRDGPGEDLIRAGGGSDSILLGRGRDTVYGGRGDDRVEYAAWANGFRRDDPDRIFGGPGPISSPTSTAVRT